ncbi:protein lin-37 homolog isoform X2 [Phlebotomus argentipes]|uniref:protein lin-37 homolog isoform X2 n=1 Tax=Phlebotomus argentipes TaxID=94469 RepID=UPI002893038D|nr:protein lin-37 homolog isoform X2 [Phlebotomus argentipes]
MPKRRAGDDEDKSDMQTARGRLKGILQDLAGQSDDDESSARRNSSSGTPKKKIGKKESLHASSVQHSYVMKLFDRSVDLAKFDDSTPLYPICRAWIKCSAVHKRSRGFSQRKSRQYYEHKVDLLSIIKEDKHKEVSVDLLPPPEKATVSRIPNLLPCQENMDKDNVKLDYNIDDPPMSKDEILSEMLPRWKNVKRNWLSQMQKVESRYQKSLEILDELYQISNMEE